MTHQTFTPRNMGRAMRLNLLVMGHLHLTIVGVMSIVTNGIFICVHLFPSLYRFLKRIHRPKIHHFALMLIGAALTIFSVQMWIHGGSI